MSVLREYAYEIEKYLRLETSPLAVKMLTSEKEIPKEAKRPKRDFKTCLALCQAFSLTRRSGMSIAMMKEDMWCPTPVIGLGLAYPPRYYLDGHCHYPDSAGSLDAGASLAQNVPRFEFGRYIGVLSAPLSSTSFEPDIVITYCNSLQLMRLLQCAAYKEGRDVTSQLSGGAACVYAMVPSVQTGEFYVSIPCDGDRRRAGAQDDEIIFTIPISKLDDLVLGLRKRAGGMPLTPNMVMQYKLSPSAANTAKSLGMKKYDGSEIEGYADRLPHE